MGHKRIPSHEGGIEKGVEQHAVRMAALGHEVTVYNRGGHNVFGKEYDGAKLKRYKGVNIVTDSNNSRSFGCAVVFVSGGAPCGPYPAL